MKIEYRYCNRCHEPMEPKQDYEEYDICSYCAAELLNKIFGEGTEKHT